MQLHLQASYKKIGIIFSLVILLALAATAFYFGNKRPWEMVSLVNLPGAETNVITLKPNQVVTQQVIVPSSSLSGVFFWLNPDYQLDPAATLTLHVKKDGQDVRTVSDQADSFISQRQVNYYGEDTTIEENIRALYVPFITLENTTGQQYGLTLELSSPDKDDFLGLEYQGDGAKYPPGKLEINSKKRNGNLGFILYERPTVTEAVSKWVLDPQHKIIWLGLGLMALGLFALAWSRYSRPKLPPFNFTKDFPLKLSRRKIIIGMLAILAAVLFVYWPATKMFLFQDDLTKLTLVKYSDGNYLKLFFTNHRYMSPGNEYQTPVAFYRPVSREIFSWLLWVAFGAAPFFYHLSSLVLLALAATLVFIASAYFFRSHSAGFTAAILWIFLSSKIPAAFWWSSNEDIIGSLFILAALILYVWYRQTNSRRVFAGLLIIFAAALFSKEHALFVLPVALLIEILWSSFRPKHYLKYFNGYLKIFAPMLLLAGFYLVARTVAIYDPTLPHFSVEDKTYDSRFTLDIGARNALAYAAWTAENQIWPQNIPLAPFVAWENALARFMAEVDSRPYYPGLVFLGVLLLAILFFKGASRRLLIFAGIWWFIMLAPNLFLVEAWAPRWLTLSSWAGVALVIMLATKLGHKQKVVAALLALITALGLWHGYTTAHDSKQVRAIATLSDYTAEALRRFERASADSQPDTVVHFVGVPHDARGSVNAYLLRLFSEQPFARTVYANDTPENLQSQDIIIDMRDVPSPL